MDIYEVNAFTKGNTKYSGSPAAVCPLKAFLPDNEMQSIASQNNLPETAFIVPNNNNMYEIRWFSPLQEVALCGHATLAAASIIFNYLKPDIDVIDFQSVSGSLVAKKIQDKVEINFPSRPPNIVKPPDLLLKATNFVPLIVLAADDYIAVLKAQEEILHLQVDMNMLATLDRRGVIFTAPGLDADFVSRVFHPKLGIGEDPACGSAHCQLMPYWSNVLGKNCLHSYQLSARPAEFFCRLENNRVFLIGLCQIYLKGKVNI